MLCIRAKNELKGTKDIYMMLTNKVFFKYIDLLTDAMVTPE